ncbi:MAG: reverse transcriptase domain-containing protein, partial [Cyanobacteria bacterium J06582_2]
MTAYTPGSEKFRALQGKVISMLGKRAIEVVESGQTGFYNRLFVVPKPTGAWRPVLSAILRNDWMVSTDLKDAYFQISVHPRSRKYLRFVFAGTVYQFRALCFGLSTAPQVFTRVFT